MKKPRSLVAIVLATLLVALGNLPALYAQSFVVSNTTLAAAITASQTSFAITSASASSGSSFGAPAAGQCLMVDGELMRITAIASTTVTVTRPPAGAGPHASLARLWTAPCANFQNGDPPNLGGAQTCSSQPAPWINARNGNVWWCNTMTNLWRGTNFATFTYGSVPVAQ